jgi:putative ABC transport system permease protein
MFWRLAGEPFRRPRNRRRALAAVAAVALGTAVAAAMLSVALDVGDRVGNELRSLGANIVVAPAVDSLPVEIGGTDYRPVTEGAYLAESSLGKLKEIFWRNNILAFAPFLYAPADLETPGGQSASTTVAGTWFDHALAQTKEEEFRTGVRALNPTWKLEGDWPHDSAAEPLETVVGRSLATKLRLRRGDTIQLAVSGAQTPEPPERAPHALRVSGILTTGGAEEEQVWVPLAALQAWTGLADKVRQAQVSALIKPEDALSRKNPQVMTPAEYDRWFCSPYLSSILHQIGDALPDTSARAVREVAETQGSVLGKLNFLMALLATVALLAATLSISSLASLSVLERRQEIGLMKAIGAQDWLIGSLFLAETALQGMLGGLLGFAGGQFLAQLLGRVLFGSPVALNWLILPPVLAIALGVSSIGTWVAVRRAARQDPARVLQGV